MTTEPQIPILYWSKERFDCHLYTYSIEKSIQLMRKDSIAIYVIFYTFLSFLYSTYSACNFPHIITNIR